MLWNFDYQTFPKLKCGGGCQFLKCCVNTRNFEILSATTLSSPEILKSRVGSARTYIRPLQVDLDLTPVIEIYQLK